MNLNFCMLFCSICFQLIYCSFLILLESYLDGLVMFVIFFIKSSCFLFHSSSRFHRQTGHKVGSMIYRVGNQETISQWKNGQTLSAVSLRLPYFSFALLVERLTTDSTVTFRVQKECNCIHSTCRKRNSSTAH